MIQNIYIYFRTEFITFHVPLLKQYWNYLFIVMRNTQIISCSNVRHICVGVGQRPIFHDHISGICNCN